MMRHSVNTIQGSTSPKASFEKIFEEDEMMLKKVSSDWEQADLLQQDGIFFLKDVTDLLGLDSVKLIKRIKAMIADGENPWTVMGVRKLWNHWAVRMRVFAPYYEQHLRQKVRSVEDGWDSNTLLQQEGRFLLSQVCALIPFTTYQIRYQAKQNVHAREEYGIWKDPALNRFVVEMPIFAGWIKRLWQGHFRS